MVWSHHSIAVINASPDTLCVGILLYRCCRLITRGTAYGAWLRSSKSCLLLCRRSGSIYTSRLRQYVIRIYNTLVSMCYTHSQISPQHLLTSIFHFLKKRV